MKMLGSVIPRVVAAALLCFAAQQASSAPIELNANFRLFGEVERFGLGWGNMDVLFGVASSGNAASAQVVGRMDYPVGSGAPATTGVLSGISLPTSGWGIIDHMFSIPFSLEPNEYASMAIGLGSDGNSGNVQVNFDFSDNMHRGGPLLWTLDQGLSLVSITMRDGGSLVDANLDFEIVPENTLLHAFAVTNGFPSESYATPAQNRALVLANGATANAKIQGGLNRGGAPTSYMVNLDVFPEPNPYVWDIAGASFYGVNNIRLTGTPVNVPEPGGVALLCLGLAALASSRKTKNA